MERRRLRCRPGIQAGITALALLGASPAWAQSEGAAGIQRIISHYLPDVPLPLVLVVFLFFLFLLEGIALFLWDPNRVQKRRLQKRLKYLDGLEQRLSKESLLKTDVLGDTPWLRTLLKKIRHLEHLQDLLTQADVSWSLGTFLLVMMVAGAGGLSLGFLRFGPPGGLAGLGAGLVLPLWVLRFMKKHRLKKFEKQLPEALDLMARGLKAGHAFASGLQMVGNEMPNPIGTEFFKTFKEYNHGMDMNAALINLCNRVDLKELRFFTTAVMIQRETGGNLVDILEKISALIRERFKLRNQVKALTAEGRLSGLILILMPPVLFLIMLRINPDYTLLLVNHPLGRMMAMTALALQGLGVLAIRKIVNIKV
uniref:Type II secretion system F family protein n=1 Tax=Desulfobacca acetoxidans TaxID=60893 RepID=A0A7V4G917_9BACT